MVERGFAALAVMVQCWENIVPEELEQNESSEKWTSGRATIGGAFSALLQRAWLSTVYQLVCLKFFLCNIFVRELTLIFLSRMFNE